MLIAFDFETTVPMGVDPEKALDPWYPGTRAFSYSTCTDVGEIIVQRMDVGGSYGEDRLLGILRDPSIRLLAHNYKYELSIIVAAGWPIPAPDRWEDTMIICKLLNNLEPTVSLDGLANKYGPKNKRQEWKQAWDAVAVARDVYGTYDRIPRPIMDVYQRADAEANMMLYLTFAPALKERPASYREYREVEIPTAWESTMMERTGVLLHKENVAKLIAEQTTMIEDAAEKAARLFGRPINLNSSKQLIQLLYNDLHIPIPAFTANGSPAIDKDALEIIEAEQGKRNPNIAGMLDTVHRVRSATKGKAMIEGYAELADAAGVIHPHFNTCLARTTRQSCSSPNLQNVSNETNQKTRYPVAARKCFRARPGHVLFSGDYQGIEMRLGVQGTGSKRLIQMCVDNFDFHDACAKSFYGDRYTNEKDPKKKKGMRSLAKNARFAMFYGCGVPTLAATLQVTRMEATAGKLRDKEQFPEFYVFMDECAKQAEHLGYIETFYGHRLYVPHDRPYAATDYKIQGSAAAIMKRAEINVQPVLREKWPTVNLLISVHDELLFEFPWTLMKRAKEWRADMTACMLDVGEEITVPLGIEWELSVGTWGDTKEIKV